MCACFVWCQLVRETALQCLTAMSTLPHARIYPMKTQVPNPCYFYYIYVCVICIFSFWRKRTSVFLTKYVKLTEKDTFFVKKFSSFCYLTKKVRLFFQSWWFTYLAAWLSSFGSQNGIQPLNCFLLTNGWSLHLRCWNLYQWLWMTRRGRFDRKLSDVGIHG